MSTRSPTPIQASLGNPLSVSSSRSSVWRAGPAARRSRTRSAAASMSTPFSWRRTARSHHSWRLARTASVKGG
jgi:hypothetical protein